MKKDRLIVVILVFGLIAAGLIFISGFSQEEGNYYSGEWKTYHNTKHGFSISYPPPYKVFEDISKDAVSFGDPPDPLAVEVFVTSSPYVSIEDWLSKNSSYKPERNINISGYKGVVTHYVSDDGEMFDDKLTIFIRNGNLFKILTFYTAHDRILNSFRFE